MDTFFYPFPLLGIFIHLSPFLKCLLFHMQYQAYAANIKLDMALDLSNSPFPSHVTTSVTPYL